MLRFADNNEAIFSFAGMDNEGIARTMAEAENRVVEVLDLCSHCGELGANTTFIDSILGCEFDVHPSCREQFKIEIEREIGRYFYGE